MNYRKAKVRKHRFGPRGIALGRNGMRMKRPYYGVYGIYCCNDRDCRLTQNKMDRRHDAYSKWKKKRNLPPGYWQRGFGFWLSPVSVKIKGRRTGW